MFRLPQKQPISAIYTNHKYRSFSSFVDQSSNHKFSPLLIATSLPHNPNHVRESNTDKKIKPSTARAGKHLRHSSYDSMRLSSNPKQGHPEQPSPSTKRPNSAIPRCKSSLNPSNKMLLSQQKLIAPCGRNFKYCINDTEMSRIESSMFTHSDYLLEPCKVVPYLTSRNPETSTFGQFVRYRKNHRPPYAKAVDKLCSRRPALSARSRKVQPQSEPRKQDKISGWDYRESQEV